MPVSIFPTHVANDIGVHVSKHFLDGALRCARMERAAKSEDSKSKRLSSPRLEEAAWKLVK